MSGYNEDSSKIHYQKGTLKTGYEGYLPIDSEEEIRAIVTRNNQPMPRKIAFLPHSCEEWEIGDVENILDLLDDLQKVLLDLSCANITTQDPAEIAFDLPKLIRLKKAYADAIELEQEKFLFDNHEVLVTYAKHLIRYLESRLNPK